MTWTSTIVIYGFAVALVIVWLAAALFSDRGRK